MTLKDKIKLNNKMEKLYSDREEFYSKLAFNIFMGTQRLEEQQERSDKYELEITNEFKKAFQTV